MKKFALLSFLLLSLSLNAQTPRQDLAPTPPMGWMTWNLFKGQINEQLLREMADAMVSQGFRDAGYEYIFIDDLWQGGRDKHNNIIADPQKFPSGIKALADYVHAKGLKLGIYSDAAPLTCGGCTASLGFEEQDARTFASWGIDYLKYDYCHAPSTEAVARQRYQTMAEALQKSGRDIVLGVCEWGQLHPERWAHHVGGQLWRTTFDVRDMWKDLVHQGGWGILDILDRTEPLYSYAGPGSWLDMDMLIVGLYGSKGPGGDAPTAELGGVGCTDTEYETQMSLWCMLSSPLAMTNDLRHMNEETRRILLNPEIIAINQDPLGRAAKKILDNGTLRVYLRPLAGDRYALAVLNVSDQETRADLDFKSLGLLGKYTLRDVWAHKDLSRNATRWSGCIQAHQTKVFVLSFFL